MTTTTLDRLSTLLAGTDLEHVAELLRAWEQRQPVDEFWVRETGTPEDVALLAALRSPVPGGEVDPDVPTATCPRCRAEVPDFDGFGVLAHTRPAYPDGCGYCSHPSRDDGVCGICGHDR